MKPEASDLRVQPCVRCDGDGRWTELRGHYRVDVECWACDGTGVVLRERPTR